MASVGSLNQLAASSSVVSTASSVGLNSVVNTDSNKPHDALSASSNNVLNPCQSLLHIPVILNHQCCLHSPGKPQIQSLEDVEPIVCQPAHVYVNKLAHPECVLNQPSGANVTKSESLVRNGEISEVMCEATNYSTVQNAKCVLRKKGRASANVGVKRHSYPVSLLGTNPLCQNCHSSKVGTSLLTGGAEACINSSALSKSSLYASTSLQDYLCGKRDTSLERICACDQDIDDQKPRPFCLETTDGQKYASLTQAPCVHDVQTQTDSRALSNGKDIIASAAHEELCSMAKKLIKFQMLSDTSTFTDFSFVCHENSNQNSDKTFAYPHKEPEKILEDSLELTKKSVVNQSLEDALAPKALEAAAETKTEVNIEANLEKAVAEKLGPAKQSSLLPHLQCHMPQSPILSHRVGLSALDSSNASENVPKSRAVLEDIHEGSEKSSSIMSKSSDEAAVYSKAKTSIYSSQSLHDSFSSLHVSEQSLHNGACVKSGSVVSSSNFSVCTDKSTISRSNFGCSGEKSRVFGDSATVFEAFPTAKLSSNSKNYDACSGFTTSASGKGTLPSSYCYSRSFMDPKTTKSNEVNSIILSSKLKHDPSLISALPALQALTKLVDSSMSEAQPPETSSAPILTHEESYDLDTRRYSQLMGLTQSKLDDWIQLNVGGELFVTSRATLILEEPDSMLAKMFGGHHPHLSPASLDPQGRYIIDRSPRYFAPLLNYLRTGALVLDPGVNPEGVLLEARFYGLEGVIPHLERLVADMRCSPSDKPLTRHDVVGALLTTPPSAPLRFQAVNLSGADLSWLDLSNINFKYADLRGADLTGANLSSCNLERAKLGGARLTQALLLNVRMVCADLPGASMRRCVFENPSGGTPPNLEGVNLRNSDLEGSMMAHVNLRVSTLKNANLRNCDLRMSVLAGADLENCDLSGSNLLNANLRGANLKNASFELMQTPLHMSQTCDL